MHKLLLKNAYLENDLIRVMEFEPEESATEAYTAGAHIDFDLPQIGLRSYSLIDWEPHSERPNTYRIAVQREADGDGGSKAMHALSIGDSLFATPPKNSFEVVENDNPVLLIGGGIGITPLISMATELSAARRPYSFHYAARSRARGGFITQLTDHFKDDMSFHFDDDTPINLKQILEAQDPSSQIYVCGPKGMIEAVQKIAQDHGFQLGSVHVELFTSPEAQAGDSAFEVEIKNTGEVYEIPPEKSIIDVLEAAGKDLMYDCQRGDCGICQTDVISGTPDHRDVVLSEADKAAGEVMQICVSRAKSKRLVLDL